jgi:glycosyltransferase involved in cell wall biosynthesis
VTPRIAVVVPTRNRPDHAEPCVRAVLASPERDLELVLIDQSDTDATEHATAIYRTDPRFRHVRTTTRGASNARNLGIDLSVAPIVLFTDDDCRVAADWIQRVEEIFDRDPVADIIFGRVTIPSDLAAHGVGADFEPHEREYQDRLPAADVAWGIGANMSVRRSLFARIGTFDPLLGPGAPFHAGEECDLMLRALARRYKVVNAVEVAVSHLGVRQGAAASALWRGYGVAMGATLAKHMRMRTRRSVRLTLTWLTHFGWRGLRNVLRAQSPSGLGLVAGMIQGVVRSCSHPIDRARGVYSGSARLALRPQFHR